MKRLLVVTALLLAGCEKTEPSPGPAAVPAKTLGVAPLLAYPSPEAWCAGQSKGTCRGEWVGHPSGTSALGAYRFIVVEYTELRDGQGPTRDVLFELKTARGFSYLPLGHEREGKQATALMVKDVVDRPGALEVRTTFRSRTRAIYSDYHSAIFILPGANGPGAVEVALGKTVGDDTGKTSGSVGEAQWQAGKVSLKGASLADGEWAIAAH
jgi:hypothetical protein